MDGCCGTGYKYRIATNQWRLLEMVTCKMGNAGMSDTRNHLARSPNYDTIIHIVEIIVTV